MLCLCFENSNCDQWALTVTSGAIYWTIKHWSLNMTVGVIFIKLWYIIIIIVINNYIDGKILEIFQKIIPQEIFRKNMKFTWNIFRPRITSSNPKCHFMHLTVSTLLIRVRFGRNKKPASVYLHSITPITRQLLTISEL